MIKKRSIRQKLMISYFLIVGICLLVSGIIFNIFIRQYFINSYETTLTREAQRVAITYINSSPDTSNNQLQTHILISAASKFVDGTYYIIDKNGNHLHIQQRGNTKLPYVPLNRLVKTKVFVEGKPFVGEFPTDNPNRVFVAYPIQNQGQITHALIL